MKHQRVTVTPTKWSHRGSAVAFDAQGHPLDIWAGIVDETCEVDITYHGQNRSSGIFVRSIGQKHHFRHLGQSTNFHLSGSCPLMHMTQEGQHQAKLSMIQDSLKKFGLERHTPKKMISSTDDGKGYRHTVKLMYGRSKKGNLRLGAYARGTHHIVQIDDTDVVTPILRQCMKKMVQIILKYSLPPYEPSTGQDGLRHVIFRQSRKSGRVLVTLVSSRPDPLITEVAQIIQHHIKPVVGVQLHVNNRSGNAIYARDAHGEIQTRNLVGESLIYDSIGSKTLAIGAGDFFQINPHIADKMCSQILNEFSPQKEYPVLDLYCGVGAMTMSLAEQHGWALGVEVVRGAIIRAQENARRNNVFAEFIAGDVSTKLPTIFQQLCSPNPLVVVNPSRSGLGEDVVQKIVEGAPIRIAYVSCNPKTLVKDLASFRSKDWGIDHIQAYDMLPQTSHSELVAILSPLRAL
ncbi:MAG: 23S rRNA (uracil(1939)-C(5))-methyltransferase RlmD [Deltaproteobacteria bacterium]|nr:23S rRNA (uracil(1939)-C(5))-methyltransferase RlmD [Deltaproteobacteria bacterium]